MIRRLRKKLSHIKEQMKVKLFSRDGCIHELNSFKGLKLLSQRRLKITLWALGSTIPFV